MNYVFPRGCSALALVGQTAAPVLRVRSSGRPMTLAILLIEDDDVDVKLMQRVIRRLGAQARLFHTTDGVQALEMLAGKVPDAIVPQPCLIFLDLNLPRMTGFEILDRLQRDPGTAANTVYVLTTSLAKEDSARALSLGAAGCIDKCDDVAIGNVITQYVKARLS